ncbi:MAG: AI-2E family transporter [Bacteroidetes bacterium]|nr:AI-2E family transporter [Bacteroidota bacterium]MBS1541571.1 AI-2E family transporter [Bacteroidota bacterium]
MLSSSTSRLDRIYKSLVTLALIIAALILTKNIMVPIVFAGLFAIVLLPLTKRLEKKTGKIFAIIIVLLISLLVVAVVSWFIISQLSSLVASLPGIEQKFYQLINETSDTLNQQLKISTEEQVQLVKEGLRNLSSYASDLLLSTSYLIYFFIQIPIYIFLFLYYRDRFMSFLSQLRPSSNLKWKDEIQQVVRGYISGLTIVVLIAGVLNSLGLLLLGIDHAIFFGFLSGLLTMIPYVGITMGAALPTLLALVTKDSAWYAVGVIGVHGFVQFLEGNFITPKVTGSRISINALAAVIALLLGGKIWGIAGMILAVPAMGILKIILNYSQSLQPLVVLLGDEAPDEEKPNLAQTQKDEKS